MRADKLSTWRGLVSLALDILPIFLAMALLGFIVGLGLWDIFSSIDTLWNVQAVKPRCPRWSVFPFG